MKRSLLLLFLIFFLTSCSNQTVKVVLKEMTVSLDRSSLSAGEITFEVTNEGNVSHKLVIIKTDLPANELLDNPEKFGEVLEIGKVGEIENIEPSTTSNLSLNLDPGHYVVFCNKVGHYWSGMYTELIVK